MLDEVELRVWIGNREVLVRGIASKRVAEMLLGIDLVETQGAVWNLEVHSRVYPLKARTNGSWCRRIIVQEPIVVPARNEYHVVDSTMHRDLKSAWSTWFSKPGSPRDEQMVARAIVRTVAGTSPC